MCLQKINLAVGFGEADQLRADAQAQKHVLDFLTRFVDDVLEDLRQVNASASKATSSLQESMQIHSNTLLIADSMKV